MEILLTLAQYISSTPCYVYKLQLFFWLDKTERATDRGACMCSRASCLGLGEPEDRGMERSKRKSPLQMVPRRNGHGETSFRRRLPFRPLHSSISGVGATATPLRAIRIAQAGRSRTRTFSAPRSVARSVPSGRRSPPNVSDYANAYDAKQLGNPIGVSLVTNTCRLTHGFRRHTGKYPRCLSLPPSGSVLLRY